MQLEAALRGKDWNKDTLETAQDVLAEELSLPDTVPGGMAAYRQTLALSFLYKFYVSTCLELSKALEKDAALPASPTISAVEASAAQSFLSEDRPLTHGSQIYEVPSGGLQSTSATGQDHAPLKEERRAPVGQPLMHSSALQQCTGEAKYTDDMPKLPGTLHGVLFLSERPHAKLL
ncbi:Xanthine dehydrogenase, partial [Durusdinium trenchii]